MQFNTHTMDRNTFIQNLSIKLIYFLAFASFAAWLSYFYVYLKEVPKLSGFEIGTIAATQQINTILFVPLWGVFADKYGRRKMLMLALAATVILLLALWMQTTFIFLLLFMIVLTFFYNPLTTLLDSIALDFEEQYKTSSYGEMRLWASIGWAIGSFTTGYFVNTNNLYLIFPISSSILVITLLIVRFMYKPMISKKATKPVKYADLIDTLKQKPALFRFLLLIFVYTICTAPIQLFINLYFNEINATTTQIGIAFAVQALSELPFFFYGKRIVQKYGPRNVLVFTMVVSSIRMFGYGMFGDPVIAIAIGSLQGICLALFFVAMVEYVQGSVPPELRSSGQSMIYTFFGAGMCIGNLLTGYLKDTITIQKTMIMDAGLIIILVVYLLLKVKRLKKNNGENVIVGV